MGNERVKRFWTLGRADDPKSSMACDLINSGRGLEVRCHAGETVVHRQDVASLADALNLCEAWKALYCGRGWVERFE